MLKIGVLCKCHSSFISNFILAYKFNNQRKVSLLKNNFSNLVCLKLAAIALAPMFPMQFLSKISNQKYIK